MLPCIPVADQLMPSRVIDAGVSLGKLPDLAFNAVVNQSRKVHRAHRAVLKPIRVWQAQLDGQGLQRAISLQEQQGPGSVDVVAFQLVDALKEWHEVIVVIYNVEPVAL